MFEQITEINYEKKTRFYDKLICKQEHEINTVYSKCNNVNIKQ